MDKDKCKYEMPLGFGMALAQNPEAMEKFSSLSDGTKKELIEGTHFVRSREEMHRYVKEIATKY